MSTPLPKWVAVLAYGMIPITIIVIVAFMTIPALELGMAGRKSTALWGETLDEVQS